MKKLLTLSAALCMCASLCAAKLSPEEKLALDSSLFLKPYIEAEMKNLSGQLLLDAGHAVAELEHLPYADQSFTGAVCIEVEKKIPSTMNCIHEGGESHEIGLGAFVKELARVTEEGGKVVIAAPASYDVVFSDGSLPEEAVQAHIQTVLSQIGTESDPIVIKKNLSELNEVMRATFVESADGIKLVRNEKELVPGQKIWRKTPGDVTSCFYHSEAEYLIAFKLAGLHCEEIKRPCFFGKVKYEQWLNGPHICGKTLGEGYIMNNPYNLYYTVKKS